MAVLTWVLIALAIWHFTVFVPDRFAGGIVGAFAVAIAGGVIGGVLISGFDIPTRHATDVGTVAVGVPGTLIALLALWLWGARREAAEAAAGDAA